MNELRDNGYPCKDCSIRKEYAKTFDIHFSGEDYDNWKKERDLSENAIYNQ